MRQEETRIRCMLLDMLYTEVITHLEEVRDYILSMDPSGERESELLAVTDSLLYKRGYYLRDDNDAS